MEFPVYGESHKHNIVNINIIGFVLCTFRQVSVSHQRYLITTFFFGKRPSCRCFGPSSSLCQLLQGSNFPSPVSTEYAQVGNDFHNNRHGAIRLFPTPKLDSGFPPTLLLHVVAPYKPNLYNHLIIQGSGDF